MLRYLQHYLPRAAVHRLAAPIRLVRKRRKGEVVGKQAANDSILYWKFRVKAHVAYSRAIRAWVVFVPLDTVEKEIERHVINLRVDVVSCSKGFE